MRFTMLAALIWVAACGKDNDRNKGGDSGFGTNPTATGTGSGAGTGATATGVATGTGTGTGTTGTPQGIEIGNGAQNHVAATPGQAVALIHGPQNGWHIEVSGSVVGLGSIVGLETWADRTDTGAQIATNGTATFLQLAAYDENTQTGWFAGERTLVTAPGGFADVCPLDGVEIRLCARAEDLAAPGTFSEGCATVTAHLEPDDLVACASGTAGTGTGTGTGTP